MKRGTIDNPKFGRLKRRLNQPTFAVVGLLEMLWHFTAKNAMDGAIGKWSNEDIAVALDWPGDENELINALLATGWLDPSDQHRLIVHDWAEHCDDAVHLSVARKVELFADGRAPSVQRMSKNERERVENLYDTKLGKGILALRAVGAYSVRTKPATVRTERETVRTESAQDAPQEHTESAQQAHEMRTAIPSQAPPSPPIPSQAIPSPPIPPHQEKHSTSGTSPGARNGPPGKGGSLSRSGPEGTVAFDSKLAPIAAGAVIESEDDEVRRKRDLIRRQARGEA